MSKSKTIIPFSPLRFVDNPPTQQQIERRLKAHLRREVVAEIWVSV